MSFSFGTKEEICKKTTKDALCCKQAELLGLICFSAIITYEKKEFNIKMILENTGIAEKICLLTAEIFDISPIVSVNNNKFMLSFSSKEMKNIKEYFHFYEQDDAESLYFHVSEKFIEKQCCKLSFLRGAFLGGGYVANPEKSYHLEFATRSYDVAMVTCNILINFDIQAKLTTRKSDVLVYVKESDKIADFLGTIGAHSSFMDVYNAKIYKELRNNVNRRMNCDNANMEKTAYAAAKQILAIEKIEKLKGMDYLNDDLKEIAFLRIEFPEDTLRELGQKLSTPLGKSGVNRRLKKLQDLAEDL